MPVDRTQVAEWMGLARRGDDDAFALLASAVQDDLFRLALANGAAWPDAAEATQETLMRAYRRRKQWRPGPDALAWLHGILINVCHELWRSSRRRATVSYDLAAAPAPDRDAAETDELARLGEALTHLPPRQREAIACRYLRGMDVRQTAAAMGCAEGTVKAACSAALAALRNTMGCSK